MKEDIEVDLESLNKVQLLNLLQLGEIDTFTYRECIEELNKNNIFLKLYSSIKKFISVIR